MPGDSFKLAAEAYRINIAHLFDPMMAVHMSNVEPSPHQLNIGAEASTRRSSSAGPTTTSGGWSTRQSGRRIGLGGCNGSSEMNDQTFLDHLIPLLDDRPNDPLVIPWPSPANIGGFFSFSTVGEWHGFVMGLGLNQSVPEIVAAKFRRAQKLFLLGWIDADLIKAGELVGLTALEFALKDRYGTPSGNNELPNLLKHMVEKDGLTDEKIPIVQRCGGTIVDRLAGDRLTGKKSRPSLADIRNSLAHGDAFDGLPWSGLLELIRDLIHYAYREPR